jgi:AraC-like DNA-binding protein
MRQHTEIITPDLPHLGFRRFQPHAQLRPWVQCYWSIHKHLLPGLSYQETLYPDGGTSLNFDLLDYNKEASFFVRQALVTAPFQGSFHRFGIRFHPGGAAALFGLDIGDLLTSDHLPSDHLAERLGVPGVRQHQKALRQADSVLLRVSLTDEWLLHQAQLATSAPGLLQHALALIARAPSRPVDDLIATLNCSRRKLERLFRRDVGMAPAKLRSLYRVSLAREMIKSRTNMPLVDVAQSCGFYDQAHFNHQFSVFMQQTPGNYRQRHLNKRESGLARISVS